MPFALEFYITLYTHTHIPVRYEFSCVGEMQGSICGYGTYAGIWVGVGGLLIFTGL